MTTIYVLRLIQFQVLNLVLLFKGCFFFFTFSNFVILVSQNQIFAFLIKDIIFLLFIFIKLCFFKLISSVSYHSLLFFCSCIPLFHSSQILNFLPGPKEEALRFSYSCNQMLGRKWAGAIGFSSCYQTNIKHRVTLFSKDA